MHGQDVPGDARGCTRTKDIYRKNSLYSLQYAWASVYFGWCSRGFLSGCLVTHKPHTSLGRSTYAVIPQVSTTSSKPIFRFISKTAHKISHCPIDCEMRALVAAA